MSRAGNRQICDCAYSSAIPASVRCIEELSRDGSEPHRASLFALELPHQGSHFCRRLATLSQQVFYDAVLIRKWSILTHLPFPDEASDRHFESHDRLQLLFDES